MVSWREIVVVMMLTKRGVKNVYAVILIMKDQLQDLQNLQDQPQKLHQKMVVDLLIGLAMVFVMMKITTKFVDGMVETVVVRMFKNAAVKSVNALILLPKPFDNG